ncbi:hypothetical protein [Candidatus Pelagibacter communis]|uniref:hypothetical protein n=1 Tax=Pelagibacter ubique TaxID=198252 RepID=UPI0003610D96|nr:hypothetical protein [Candidatus Pelagibacter ubique]
MRILIHISALQKWFLMMLSNLLGIKNKVFFIIIDKIVETLLKNKLGKKIFNKIYIEENVNNNIDEEYKSTNDNAIIKEAIILKKKYGTSLSFLIGKVIALGKDYLLNVDRYLDIIRANWNKEKESFWQGHIQIKATNWIITFNYKHSLKNDKIISDYKHLDPYRGEPTYLPPFQLLRINNGQILDKCRFNPR